MEIPYDSVPSNEMKTINGDLNAKLGREEISRDIIGKESVCLISNNNGLKSHKLCNEQKYDNQFHSFPTSEYI